MSWLRIIAAVVSTLLVMRLFSWLLAWLVRGLLGVDSRKAAVASNLAALSLLVALLFLDREAGEPLDPVDFIFAAAVYLSYLWFDLLWIRRKTFKTPGAGGV